ncbi:MAG: hypothetical protein IJM02_06675 [Clostridia bacterium]|nr:hypothetical protein [Clostridia bacterium]
MYQNFMNTPMPMTTSGLYQNFGRQEIVKVSGENGARAYQMAPNSSALLLDENNPIIWLAQTDGAGYKTVSAYSITPYKPAPVIDINNLDERLKRIEAIISESDHKSNGAGQDKPAASKSDLE